MVEGVISKGEFARRRNVSAGRVSQWISEGKIHGAAIVGEGRNARIDERLACAQLDRTLDVSQRLGNGLHTNLAPPAGDRVERLEPAGPTVADQIQLQKLEQLLRANREAARQEAIAAGHLTDANGVRQSVGREIAQLVSRFEGALTGFAAAVASQLKVPQRDVLHVLRTEFGAFRAAETGAARAAAATLPATTDFDVPAAPSAKPPAAVADNETGSAGAAAC